MTTKETTLAQFKATRACNTLAKEYGRKYGRITVTAKAYQLSGNQHPHFSVTAKIYAPQHPQSPFACGCLHDEILRFFPKLAPVVRMHLSNADDGEPMHGEANGLYQLAGAIEGNLGEQYHSGNSERHFPITPNPETPWRNTEYRFPTRAEALESFAEYVRITVGEAEAIRDEVTRAYAEGEAEGDTSGPRVGNARAKEVFRRFVDSQRPRWKQEAEETLALIRSLAEAKELTPA